MSSKANQVRPQVSTPESQGPEGAPKTHQYPSADLTSKMLAMQGGEGNAAVQAMMSGNGMSADSGDGLSTGAPPAQGDGESTNGCEGGSAPSIEETPGDLFPFQSAMQYLFREDFSSVAFQNSADLPKQGARAAVQEPEVVMGVPTDAETIAHELVHVVQMRNAQGAEEGEDGDRVSDPKDAAELEASRLARQVVRGEEVDVKEKATPGVVYRSSVSGLQSLTPLALGGEDLSGTIDDLGADQVRPTLVQMPAIDQRDALVEHPDPETLDEQKLAANSAADKYLDAVLALKNEGKGVEGIRVTVSQGAPDQDDCIEQATKALQMGLRVHLTVTMSTKMSNTNGKDVDLTGSGPGRLGRSKKIQKSDDTEPFVTWVSGMLDGFIRNNCFPDTIGVLNEPNHTKKGKGTSMADYYRDSVGLTVPELRFSQDGTPKKGGVKAEAVATAKVTAGLYSSVSKLIQNKRRTFDALQAPAAQSTTTTKPPGKTSSANVKGVGDESIYLGELALGPTTEHFLMTLLKSHRRAQGKKASRSLIAKAFAVHPYCPPDETRFEIALKRLRRIEDLLEKNKKYLHTKTGEPLPLAFTEYGRKYSTEEAGLLIAARTDPSQVGKAALARAAALQRHIRWERELKAFKPIDFVSYDGMEAGGRGLNSLSVKNLTDGTEMGQITGSISDRLK